MKLTLSITFRIQQLLQVFVVEKIIPFYFLIIFSIFFCSTNLFGQDSITQFSLHLESENPVISHFQRKDFQGDAQFWSAAENKEGVMFLGNNDGVLIYDGNNWKKVHLPNHSSVRSLAVDKEGKIYAGGFNELGIIQKDKFGKYTFKSLKEKLHLNSIPFENVWQITVLTHHVIFRTFKKLFVLQNDNVTQIPATSSFTHAFVLNNHYFVQDIDEGILELSFEKNQLQPSLSTNTFHNESIIKLFSIKTKSKKYAITKKGNIYGFHEGVAKPHFVKNIFGNNKNQIISGIQLDNGNMLFGTLSNGVISLKENKQGLQAQWLEGLQGKTVLNLYQTVKENVWALLDNGLDFMDYHSPRTTLFDSASVYDVLIRKKRIYLATNQGVYVAKLNGQKINPFTFKKINELQGQAWSLSYYHHTILVSHDRGIFQLHPNLSVTQIGKTDGFWKIIPTKRNPNQFLANNYEGLFLLTFKGNQWSLSPKIRGFNESSRDILPAKQPFTYWICHGYKGVYKVTLNSKFTRATAIDHYTDQNGLPSPFNINVFKWNQHIVFTTNQGIYQFNPANKKFVPYPRLNKILDTTLNTRKIIQNRDKTWVIEDDEVGYFYTDSIETSVHKNLFLQTKGTFNRGMESIVPISKNRVLLGTHTGLYLYDLNTTKDQPAITTTFTAITFTNGNSINQLPISSNSNSIELPNQTSTLHFSFAAPKMSNSLAKQYSYKLEDIDKIWSPWEALNFKEYNLLAPGTYTFKVRSRNALGIKGEIAVYTFSILPKWYQTKLAYFLYLALAIILIIILVKLIQRKIAKENKKTKLREQRTQKLLQLELDQLRLQKDKEKIREDKTHLEQDIVRKSKELANYTMLLVNKKRFFDLLQNDLRELKKSVKNKRSKKKLFEIFRKIHQNKIDEKYWKVFDENFTQVHHHFFENLKNEVSSLSKRDMRLSAFIKMGLTNKEIAPLLSISVRGVETARYRLRKKLNLNHDDKLMAYFEEISRNNHISF